MFERNGNEASDAQLVDELVARQRQIAVLQADQVRLVAELSTRRLTASIAAADRAAAQEGMPDSVRTAIQATLDDATTEVALALSLAPATAGRLVEDSVRLRHSLPRTLVALADGRLDLARAQVVANAAACLPADKMAALDARVDAMLKPGRVLTRGQLASRVRSAVAVLDADAVAARRREEVARRSIGVEPRPDGMAMLTAYGPAEAILTVWHAIDAAAQAEVVTSCAVGAPGVANASESEAGAGVDQTDTRRDTRRPDTRRVGARRFDALLGWASSLLADPDRVLPRRQGQRPHILVTVAATTLLGLDQLPGHLDGYGAIPAHVARKIAAVGEWRRLLTDPTSGALLDVGRKTYIPPGALRDFVLTRDRTCTQPTCSMPSRRTQFEHFIPYPLGPTAEWNTGPACGPDHRLKTHRPGWRVERLPDGSVAWTVPTGHVYLRPPDEFVPGAVSPAQAQDRDREPDDAAIGVAELRRAIAAADRDTDAGAVSVVTDSLTDALYASTPPF